MKKIKYFIIILFAFILFIPSVFAGTNMSTKYNVTMFDYKTYMENQTCQNTNLYDYVNNIISSIDWSNTQYQTFIGANFAYDHSVNGLNMYFVKTSYVNENQGHKIWTFGLYQSSGWTYQFKTEASKSTYGGGFIRFYFNECTNATDLQAIKNYIINLVYNGVTDPNFYYPGIFASNSSTYYNTVWSMNSLSDNSSYNISGWWYYSSYDLYFASQTEASGTNKYWKTIHIVDNDTDYGYNSQLPSYYDLYPPQVNPTFIGYETSLKTFYTNLDPTDLSNYNLKINFKVPQSVLGFYQTPQEYIDNTTFDYVCSGRVDHNGYYTYDSFNCSLLNSYTLTTNTIEYTFNNVQTSQVLTNYDKIYVTIKSNYLDPNVSTTVFDYSYTYNFGQFYNTDYKGSIYENFNNLPLNFKMYFSSNISVPDSYVYAKKNNFLNYNIYYIGFSNTTNQFTNVSGLSILGNCSTDNNPNCSIALDNFTGGSVTNNIDRGLMIYQENSTLLLPRLDLFFNGGIVISVNTTANNNDFYYVDTNGDIQSGSFVKPIISNTSNDSYNISYYVDIVNDFINGLSNDCIELSNLTQEFYNGIPIIFQSFIFVLFILSCIYAIYLLIKKE